MPGGNADAKNNVESVLLPAGISGDITITVTAANINSDGVPNFGTSLDQDFALVIYNATNTSVPIITSGGFAVTAESFFPTNGVADPGEQITVNLALKNNGTATTTNLVVTLLATNGIALPSGEQHYGNLLSNGVNTSRTFTFTVNGACGGVINALVQLRDDSGELGTLPLTIPLGLTTVQTRLFTNAAAITIPDSGKASLYPSPITVTGLTGVVVNVTATIRGYSHSWPDDVDVLLVGPAGQKVMLMSDCGGGNARNGITLTFDSSAATSVPDSAAIPTGTYKPTNIDTTSDNFPAPAPASSFTTSLTNFNNVNPNGTWSLYVQDDNTMDGGSIAQGWCLSITTSNLACASGAGNSANVSISSTVTQSPVAIGSNVNFIVSVINSGPDPAAYVSVNHLLPAGLVFNSANASVGNCSNNCGNVNWSVGLLQAGGTASLNIQASAVFAATFTNQSTVVSTTPDPIQGNNVAHTIVTVTNAASESPGLTNIVQSSNMPPVLAPIANRTVHAGSFVTFTNTASDADQPTNALTFSLSAGAATGANIQSSSGIFSWLTADANANTTNQFAVTVTDNGAPSLSNTKSFSINVVSRPLVTDIAVTSSWVSVTWTTIPGDTYRLQLTTNLSTPQWIGIPPDLTATGTTITHTNPFVPGASHFYRVMLVP